MSATPAFHRVGSLAALRSAGRLTATIAGRKIVVFALADKVVATNARCPHNRGPLHEGDIEGTIISCPWHGYSFDLATGACADDAALVLERFEVQLRDDDILVCL
jgi:nitrite reductase (NADH) small subunit